MKPKPALAPSKEDLAELERAVDALCEKFGTTLHTTAVLWRCIRRFA
jgi:hypothetical protein